MKKKCVSVLFISLSLMLLGLVYTASATTVSTKDVIRGVTYDNSSIPITTEELRKDLKPIPRVEESNILTMKKLVRNALQNENIGIEDIANVDRDIANRSREVNLNARGAQ